MAGAGCIKPAGAAFWSPGEHAIVSVDTKSIGAFANDIHAVYAPKRCGSSLVIVTVGFQRPLPNSDVAADEALRRCAPSGPRSVTPDVMQSRLTPLTRHREQPASTRPIGCPVGRVPLPIGHGVRLSRACFLAGLLRHGSGFGVTACCYRPDRGPLRLAPPLGVARDDVRHRDSDRIGAALV